VKKSRLVAENTRGRPQTVKSRAQRRPINSKGHHKSDASQLFFMQIGSGPSETSKRHPALELPADADAEDVVREPSLEFVANQSHIANGRFSVRRPRRPFMRADLSTALLLCISPFATTFDVIESPRRGSCGDILFEDWRAGDLWGAARSPSLSVFRGPPFCLVGSAGTRGMTAVSRPLPRGECAVDASATGNPRLDSISLSQLLFL
jgi:hypothetical protein